jgi:hypothetical protein
MSQLPQILEIIRPSPSISYILDGQRNITYCNPAWDQFAIANEAPELAYESVYGTPISRWIPESMYAFYSRVFDDVENTGKLWQHSYECSSETRFRTFQMHVYPILPMNWLLVMNTKLVEHEQTVEAPEDLGVFVDQHGIITVCAHCRCVRRTDNPQEWNYVPKFLKKGIPNLSHGLCPACNLYFWKP